MLLLNGVYLKKYGMIEELPNFKEIFEFIDKYELIYITINCKRQSSWFLITSQINILSADRTFYQLLVMDTRTNNAG